MMLWQADELARAVASATTGFAVSGISIDTRTLQPGDLFVALRAERDGHDYVAQAFARGAAGAMVSRAVPAPGPLLLVDDTLDALHRLAAAARLRSAARLVAVTGSVGKTTTKEMLRRVLSAFGAVHAAEASFNNHIGVPLTLARLPRETPFAVIEIGMNHAGEILPLAELARPDVAMVTTIERAHIGQLGSLEAIMREKSSIFHGLRVGGTAIYPHETPFPLELAAALPRGRKAFTFGAGGTAGARLQKAESDAVSCHVVAEIGGQMADLILAAPGRHMAMNALASLAACHALGLDIQKAADALDGFTPVKGRGGFRAIKVGFGHAVLLDESYNASGASMRAALAVLALQPGRHLAVLGDMLELGAEAQAEHVALAPDVLRAADIVFTCGAEMQNLHQALPAERRGVHAPDAAALAPLVKAELRPNDTVLVKGSFGSRMRDIIAILEGSA